MITVDPLLLEAFRYSHTRTCVLSVYESTTKIADDIKISEGSVSADRGQKARRSLDCTIPLSQWEDVATLTVTKSRIQAWVGYDLGATSVLLPLGVFRVETLSRSNSGALKVSGISLEAYVIDDVAISNFSLDAGTNVLSKIQALIVESLPDATFEITTYAQSQSGVTLDRSISGKTDRWEVVTELATYIGCDVYCAPDGRFRVAKKPSMLALNPVWTINEGPDGVLVGMNTAVSRAKTYNAVLAMEQNSDAAIPPFSAVVYDTDPQSPTMWGGPFGKKLYTYQDDLLTSKAACTAKATELLAVFKAEDRSLDFSAIPNPALEPDDAVQVTMLDGTVETHLLTRMTIPLGLGAWSADTLSNKDLITMNVGDSDD